MSTHRQLPNNIDIAPFQERGRWYRAFIEKDESGNAKLTYKDAGLPDITPTGYGFTMEGRKDGKNFHLVSVSSNPGIGSGTAGEPAFYYPVIGINYTDAGSQYVVDFNKPETNVSLKINDTAATVTETLNGLVQKNIDLSASVGGGGVSVLSKTDLSPAVELSDKTILLIIIHLKDTIRSFILTPSIKEIEDDSEVFVAYSTTWSYVSSSSTVIRWSVLHGTFYVKTSESVTGSINVYDYKYSTSNNALTVTTTILDKDVFDKVDYYYV